MPSGDTVKKLEAGADDLSAPPFPPVFFLDSFAVCITGVASEGSGIRGISIPLAIASQMRTSRTAILTKC